MTVPMGECELCGVRGPMPVRYERYDKATGLWHSYQFCHGPCLTAWSRLHDRLPDTGLSFSLASVGGSEREV